MSRLNCLSSLRRCHSPIWSVACLNKSIDMFAPLRLRLPLALAVSSPAPIKSFGTKINRCQNNCSQLTQIEYTNFTQNSSCCKRSLLLTNGNQDSILLRRFKTQTKEPNKSGKIPFWKRLAFVSSIGGIVAYMYYSINRDKEIEAEKVRYEEFQKAELGGDWKLIDHNGKERSSTEFRGQWILLYFGFTHCPDICPEELEKLVKIVKHFDTSPKLPSMMPIFITLDPERDTPNAIKEYLEDYKCPRLLGFTAPTVDAIKEVATKYRAYFSKGPADEDNDYIVDHTIIIYLVNPKGQFVNYFDRSRSASRIINTVTDHIEKYNELEGQTEK